MPSVPITQAAFVFCIENQDFNTQRWEELVAAIRDGFDFTDVTNSLVWGFDIDDASYELRFCEQFIELCPEFEKSDGFFCIELMASVAEIEQAVADGELDKLVEPMRAATYGEEASHE